MKKINFKYIHLVTLLAFIFITSCSKKIDLQPQFSLDGSKPLASLDQADFVLTGSYNRFLGAGYFNSIPTINSTDALQPASFSGLPDMMSDDLVETFEDFPNYRKASEWTYTSDDQNVQITFANCYNVISGVNIILRDIDALSAEDNGRANNIKAQALTIRAMAHFDLMRYFAPTFDRNSTELGVAYVKEYNATGKPTRNTIKDCYDNIFLDISDAIAAFNAGTGATGDDSRLSLNAAYALKARASLYAGQWQDAVDASTTLINEIPLADINDFPGIWTDNNEEEVIWKVKFQSVSDGTPYENVFYARGNKSLYRPTLSIDGLYDASNDVRHDTYIATVGTFNGIGHDARLAVIKHRGKSPASTTVGGGFVDWKVFRVAEFYLTRAEANFQLGHESDALADLNALRTARIIGFVDGTESGSALLDAIKLERRKELAFEGHRFFDLKRWDKTPIERCGEADSPSSICELIHTSRAWAWPIPETEISANPNMVQNPGY
ncbi:MAG: RagB/SusD family nutrient uptake outer membrane protein [Ferruginibacter sp.]